MEKPTLPKGTRDFGPLQMAKRQFIMDAIRKVFQKYGFQPLETPAMENLSTLTGKYGDEGDQLLFRVLESGDALKPLKIKLLGLEQAEFNRILLRHLNIIKEVLKDVFSASFDSGFKNVRSELSKHNISNYNGALQLSQTEAENLSSFIDSNQVIISDAISVEGNFMLSNGSGKENIAYYFSFLERDFINTSISDLITNHILSTREFDVKGELIKTRTKEVTHLISEKGLRYDLTVPFARYVVMNRGEITFPFKRYQIQPVWRADRPQKGRYREFYQCDADVVGTNSLICEAEIILMINEVFKALNIADYTIKINHRGILSGLAESADTKEKESSLFVAIDKLDKIGEEKVREELRGKEFTEASLNTVFNILNFKGTTSQKIDFLISKFSSSETGKKGIADLKEVLSLLNAYGASDDHVEFDIALARGLSYYTGCIFEVKINNVAIGSVSGGGRYDNLTKAFGDKENLSGVGFSFGVDRIYDAMEELKLFPPDAQVSSKVLVCHFDEESKIYGLNVLRKLREKGIASEIYPDSKKIDKQLDYANKKMIPFTIVIGSNEVKSGVLAFKNMKKGEQQSLTLQQILDQF